MRCVNARLRSVLAQRGVSPDALAEVCKVDPKTVHRWLGGRVPHPRHRFTAARFLGCEESFLWPPCPRGPTEPAVVGGAGAAVVAVHANRASVPRELWLSLLRGACRAIDVLVFSGTFFAQSDPHVARLLAERAAAGTRVRLCFGDPDGAAVRVRGREEGIGDALPVMIRASLTHYQELLDQGCEVRLHDTTLYHSLFRYDDNLLVNPHVWGQPAMANPVLHLRRGGEHGWFDHYAQSFDAVWAGARPWQPHDLPPPRRSPPTQPSLFTAPH